jgi:PAS domain S-box-containing protein
VASSNPGGPDLTRLRQAVDASGEVIFMTDRNGVFTFVNPQFERLYGYSASEVVGRATPRVLKGGEIPPEQYAALWDRLLHGQSIEVTFVNVTKDGRPLDIEAALSPVHDDANAIVGFMAIERDVTARKQAEAALRQERDRAARYLEVADVVLLALDLEGRITMINRKGSSILGWEERELLGRNWIETCLPERIRISLTEKLHHLQRGDTSRVENPVLTKTGDERLIAWRNTVLRDESGRIVGTLSSGEDITERRHAERALGESQAQLQLISDNVLDLVGQIRLDGTLVYVSPSYQTVLGYSPATLIGTSAFALVHPDDDERVRGVFAEAIQRRTTGRAEFRSRRADGTFVWLEAVGKLLFDSAQRPIGAILSSRDISQRKRAEEASRDYDRRLRMALASANMAVFTQDRELRYTWVHNPQLGMTAEQVLGKTDLELLPQALAQQVTQIKRRALETGDRVREEVSAEVDGQQRFFELFVEPLKRDDGTTEGVIVASLDTTARRHLEGQLRQAQKLEAIGSLAGGIAHDFNNLLTAIVGYTDLALAQLDADSPLRKDLEEVSRAGRSAESLTRQLLIFSRKSIVQPVPLRLNDVVSRLDKILRRMVGEHVQFDLKIDEGLGFVKADAGQLEQVLMNLVVNARDAMPMGGMLTIETRLAELDEAFARAQGGSAVGAFDSLTVVDTGCGMTPDVLAQIFDPFFTTKGPDKGTGLGLATVQGIVQQAGGYVTVSSVPDRGSAFTVYLPRVAEEDDTVPAGSRAAAASAGTEAILFVEDDENIRTMAARALQRYGYVVVPARDATEAAARAAFRTFDLLITDIVLPGINGRALAEYLRKSNADLKVVFTSGFTDDSELLRASRSAGIPFVQKPYTMDSLARTVRRVLDGS